LPFLVTSLQERVDQHGRYREQRSPVASPCHQPTGESGSAWQVQRAALTSCQSLSPAYRREWISMAGTESSAHQLPVLVTSLQSRVGQHGRYREQRSPVAFLVTSLQMRVGQNGRYREQRSPVASPSHKPTKESGSEWQVQRAALTSCHS
jgi:hypothetical protein